MSPGMLWNPFDFDASCPFHIFCQRPESPLRMYALVEEKTDDATF